MKKILALMALVVVSLGVLFLFDGAGEANAPEYYFRDNTTISPPNGLQECYIDFPWAVEMDLTEYISAMKDGIPNLEGFSELSGRSMYFVDGSLFGMEIVWTGAVQPDGNTKRIFLRLYPEKPEDLAWARAYVMDYDKVTETETNGILVYGDGTELSLAKVLEFTRADGVFCQIQGVYASAEELTAILEYYMNNQPPFSICTLGEPSAVLDVGYYFRDNQTLSGKIAVPLNTSVQWRKLSDRQEEVLEMLPEMYGFDSFSCWGRYDDEDIYGIQLDWIYTEAENNQSVSMYLFPEAPDKYGKVDGMYNLDYEHVTVTERDGATIYGDGTSDSTARVLEMVLENGTYCQIVNRCAEGVLASPDSLEAMRELVDFLLENDLAFDDFLVLEAMAE